MNLPQFFAAYNEQVKKARDGKLEIADFQGTTISLTNPGTIGTVASNPRLMAGQSAIIATGAIEYPAEYQAMTAGAFSQIGISKTVTITSTYDHRVIQGAESGLFLAKIHELLIGKHDFYERSLPTSRSIIRRCVGPRITIRRCSAATACRADREAGECAAADQRLSRSRPSARRHRSAQHDVASCVRSWISRISA